MKRLFAALLICCCLALPCFALGTEPSPGLTVPLVPDGRTGRYKITISDTETITESSVTRSVERTGVTARTEVFVEYPLDAEQAQTYYITVTALPEPGRSGLDTFSSKTASLTTGCCKGVEGAFILGNGSESDPYQIYTPAQLAHVQRHLSAHFIQKQDIALTGSWTPLGTFAGVYDGGGYSISGLDTTDGLFTSVKGQSAVVRHVVLTGPKAKFGTIAGNVTDGATISDCTVTGAVVFNPSGSYSSAGGLIGTASNSTIIRCTVTGTVGGQPSVQLYRGGIVGHNTNSTYIGCLSSVQFNGSAPDLIYTGGIVGATGGNTSPITMQNCHWTNPVYAVGRDASYGGNFTPNTGGSFGNSRVDSIDGLS